MPPAHFHDQTPVPQLDDVVRLWDRFGMLDNIREHSRVVCRVALTLSDWLSDSGVLLCRRAVEVGALLHDIAKTPCLGTSRRHDQEGAALLRDLGYPELAYLVGVHVRLPDPHPVDESFIVYYADKRVRHDELVNIEQRFDYIADRYGKGCPSLLERIEKGRRRALAAESELFALLGSYRSPDGVKAGTDEEQIQGRFGQGGYR